MSGKITITVSSERTRLVPHTKDSEHTVTFDATSDIVAVTDRITALRDAVAAWIERESGRRAPVSDDGVRIDLSIASEIVDDVRADADAAIEKYGDTLGRMVVTMILGEIGLLPNGEDSALTDVQQAAVTTTAAAAIAASESPTIEPESESEPSEAPEPHGDVASVGPGEKSDVR